MEGGVSYWFYLEVHPADPHAKLREKLRELRIAREDVLKEMGIDPYCSECREPERAPRETVLERNYTSNCSSVWWDSMRACGVDTDPKKGTDPWDSVTLEIANEMADYAEHAIANGNPHEWKDAPNGWGRAVEAVAMLRALATVWSQYPEADLRVSR